MTTKEYCAERIKLAETARSNLATNNEKWLWVADTIDQAFSVVGYGDHVHVSDPDTTIREQRVILAAAELLDKACKARASMLRTTKYSANHVVIYELTGAIKQARAALDALTDSAQSPLGGEEE